MPVQATVLVVIALSWLRIGTVVAAGGRSCEPMPDFDAWAGSVQETFAEAREICLAAREREPGPTSAGIVLNVFAFDPPWNEARARLCLRVAIDIMRQCGIGLDSGRLVPVRPAARFRAMDLTELNHVALETPASQFGPVRVYLIDEYSGDEGVAFAVAPAAGGLAASTVWITQASNERRGTKADRHQLGRRIDEGSEILLAGTSLNDALGGISCGMSLAHELSHLLRGDHVVVERPAHDDRGHSSIAGNVMTQGVPLRAWLDKSFRFEAAQCRDIVRGGLGSGLIEPRESHGGGIRRTGLGSGAQRARDGVAPAQPQ